MKNSTLVVFLMLSGLLTLRAERRLVPFHVDNIVLKNFQAVSVNEGAKVIWEFTSEEKDVICNLEKSTDGINFITLRTIHITSTRQNALHSFTDKQVSGQTFYRLRITKETYIPFISQIVSFSFSAPGGVNPQQQPGIIQTNSVFGDLLTQDKTMYVRLVDLNGQSRIKQYMKGTELDRSFRSSLASMPAGYYVLRVNDMQSKTLLNKCIYKF